MYGAIHMSFIYTHTHIRTLARTMYIYIANWGSVLLIGGHFPSKLYNHDNIAHRICWDAVPPPCSQAVVYIRAYTTECKATASSAPTSDAEEAARIENTIYSAGCVHVYSGLRSHQSADIFKRIREAHSVRAQHARLGINGIHAR